MTDDATPAEPDAAAQAAREKAREEAREEARRRRRLAEIFGDVIPEQTSDDADESSGADRRTEDEAQEAWLRSQVPPHHG
jgi:hypothetical protein